MPGLERNAPYKKVFQLHQAFPIGVGLFAFGLFGAIFYFRVWTDIQLHLETVEQMLLGEVAIPGHFLFFGLVAVLGFFQANMYVLALAGAVLLAVAVAAKYQLSREYLAQCLEEGQLNSWISILAAFILLFAFCLPGPDTIMLGQFPPNVWHNSTMIFLMPAVIVLFLLTANYWQDPSPAKIKWILLWTTLNIFIKPSFFICLLPVYSLALLIKFKFSKAFWLGMIPMAIGTLLLLGQYLYIFEISSPVEAGTEEGIVIRPFYVWSLHSSNLLWSFFATLAFPLTVAIFYWKTAKQEFKWRYVWGLFGFGFMILILVAETGERAAHGNFFWQVLIINYLLFLVSVGIVLPQFKKGFGYKEIITSAVFALHVLTGFVYLGKMFLEKTSLI